MGTALWNESAGEAVHADFDKFYRDFIVKDLNSEVYNYIHKLLKAVNKKFRFNFNLYLSSSKFIQMYSNEFKCIYYSTKKTAPYFELIIKKEKSFKYFSVKVILKIFLNFLSF